MSDDDDATDNIIKLAEHSAKDTRPVIRLGPGRLHVSVAETEAALIEACAPLYDHGGELVRPVTEDAKGFRGHKTKVVRLRPWTPDAMRDQLSRVVRFEKYEGRRGTYVATAVPYDVAKTIIAHDGNWGFPRLAGVITTPTLRPDGSILSEAGYDPATALLLVEPPTMAAIPDYPGPADARNALRPLEVLLDEFPFVDEESRAVALSALITPVVRGALSTAPLHVLDAPEAGTGKSYLVDLAAAIATGEAAPVIAAGRTEEETEKRLVAELLSGQPIVSIDNLNGNLHGDFLCQAVERPIVRPRVLGKSENRRIPNAAVFFANGNNLRLVGDVVRRSVRCRLDAKLEHPELRQFRGDPLQAVLADRGRFIAAILTIVRAYQVAGYPDCQPPLASFADWSRLVRSALVWLGCADPVATTAEARNEDPARADLQAVVAAWRAAIGVSTKVTAGELKQKAETVDSRNSEANKANEMLRKALDAIARARRGSEIDTLRLGRWLSRNKNRVACGCAIVAETDKYSNQLVWQLKEPEQEKPPP
jgi:putative DNA primase/helicase